MKINDIFHSIQGEGPAMGEAAIFVRFFGCNLDCQGCDTYQDVYINMPIEDIAKICDKYPLVIITGGEPTLQMDGMIELIDVLAAQNNIIDIETNGTNIIPLGTMRKCRYIVVSPKRDARANLEKWGVIGDICESINFKFVIGDNDWCWKEEHIDEIKEIFRYDSVWLMPFSNKGAIDLNTSSYVWDLALKHGFNYSDRLHLRVERK